MGVKSLSVRSGGLAQNASDAEGYPEFTPGDVPEFNYPEAGGSWTYYAFQWSSASPISLLTVLAGKRLLTVRIDITTAFDGVGTSISVGTASDIDEAMTAAQNVPSEIGSYEVSPGLSWGIDTALRLTLVAGTGASVGIGLLTLQVEEE